MRLVTQRAANSAPPLSLARLRQRAAEAQRMRWRGVGLTACAGDFGLARAATAAATKRAMPRLMSPASAARDMEAARAEGDRARDLARQALREFFASHGGDLVVLDEPRFAAPGGWIGEDGGPGNRTGIFQLADMEEVSTVLLLGNDAAARRPRILDVARRRPETFFLLPTVAPPRRGGRATAGRPAAARAGPPRGALELVRPNVATVQPPADEPGGDVGAAYLETARVAAWLVRTDFSDRPRCGRDAAPTSTRRVSSDLLRVMAWRRWEGLRRSIDLGSRWVVLEWHHPLIWRQVERDVRGFLYRMVEHGLVQRPGRGGFAVRCTPRRRRAGPPREEVGSAVDVCVAVRLVSPYDAALSAGGDDAVDGPEERQGGGMKEGGESMEVEDNR